VPGALTRSAAHQIVQKYLDMIYPASLIQGAAQEWLEHASAAHTRAYIDAEDYKEKANEAVAGLDI
jgi:hypothetical protein